MAEILQSFATEDIVAAIEANLESFWLEYGGFQTWDAESCTLSWFRTDIPALLYNGVLRSQFSGDIDAEIAGAIDQFSTPFHWWITPSTQPNDLGERLAAKNFLFFGNLPGMAIDLQQLPEIPAIAGLEIVQAQDDETFAAWLNIAIAGFGTPEAVFDALLPVERAAFDSNYRRYLAIWQGQPVAISALYPDAGVAGIYFVATLPEARGKGIGQAVTIAALQDAKQLGYRIGILQASQMGVSV